MVQTAPQKRKSAEKTFNVNTDAKRPKLNGSPIDEQTSDPSGLKAVTEELATIISSVTEHLDTMKLLLRMGNPSDVEELAKQGPEILKRLRWLDNCQRDQIRKTVEKREEMEKEAARKDKVRINACFFSATLVESMDC